jgi:hypothetical protein
MKTTLALFFFAGVCAFAQLNPNMTSAERFGAAYSGDTRFFTNPMPSGTNCPSGTFPGGTCVFGTNNDGVGVAGNSTDHAIGVYQLTNYDPSNISNTTHRYIAGYAPPSSGGTRSPGSAGIWVVGTNTYWSIQRLNPTSSPRAYNGTSTGIIVIPDLGASSGIHSCNWATYQAHSTGHGCDSSNWVSGIDFPSTDAGFQWLAPGGDTDYSRKMVYLHPIMIGPTTGLPCAGFHNCATIPGTDPTYMYAYTANGDYTLGQFAVKIALPASGNPVGGSANDPMIPANWLAWNGTTWVTDVQTNAVGIPVYNGLASGPPAPAANMYMPEFQQIVSPSGIQKTIVFGTSTQVIGPIMNSMPITLSAGSWDCNFTNFIPSLYRRSGNTVLATVACDTNSTYTLAYLEINLGGTLPTGQVCPSGYGYNKLLTVNSGQVTGNLNQFPMLVTGADNNLRTVPNGGQVQNANAYDVVFTDGHSPIPFELVGHASTPTYSASTGNAEWWVGVPNIYNGAVIYECYGNSGISTYQGQDTLVWSLGIYALVAHLQNGSTLSLTDSTGQQTSLANNNGVTPVAGYVTTGAAGFAQASNQYISVPNGAPLTSMTAYTFSMKINPTTRNTGSMNELLGKGNSAQRTYDLRYNGDGTIALCYSYGGGAGFDCTGSTGTVPTGSWEDIAVMYDGSNLTYYLNGAFDSTSGGHHTKVDTPNLETEIGRYSGISGAEKTFYGNIDELRIECAISRPAAWWSARRNSESSPSTFYTVTSGGATPKRRVIQ